MIFVVQFLHKPPQFIPPYVVTLHLLSTLLQCVIFSYFTSRWMVGVWFLMGTMMGFFLFAMCLGLPSLLSSGCPGWGGWGVGPATGLCLVPRLGGAWSCASTPPGTGTNLPLPSLATFVSYGWSAHSDTQSACTADDWIISCTKTWIELG
jgi:hypothetical protein